jgi:hypothetical protein
MIAKSPAAKINSGELAAAMGKRVDKINKEAVLVGPVCN